jgi:ABC-type molybdate transport system permease subunit
MMLAVVLPFWTSLLVRTYAWLVLLQRRGLVNTFLTQMEWVQQPLQLVHNQTGAVIGMAHIMLPFLVLPLYASMRSVDAGPSESLGQSRSQPRAGILDSVLSARAAGLSRRHSHGLSSSASAFTSRRRFSAAGA